MYKQKASRFSSKGFRFCTRGGNRTRTAFECNRILSPACLPVPPPEQVMLYPEPGSNRRLLNNKSLLFRRDRRAKDEIRTRDPDLGKVVLYQLSYFRIHKLHSRLRSANIERNDYSASSKSKNFEFVR